SEFCWDTDEETFDSIFAVEINGARQNLLFIFENGFDHLSGGGRRRIIRAAGLQIFDDLGAAVPGALDQLRESFGRNQLRDQNAIWRVLDSLADHVLHNFVVCVEQVVAAHAGFARNSSSDDDDVRIGGISVVVSADDVGVALFNWHGFEQVEAFTLRDSFDDVNEDNVREFFRGDPVGGGRADVSRTYDSHFLTHVWSFAQDQKLL